MSGLTSPLNGAVGGHRQILLRWLQDPGRRLLYLHGPGGQPSLGLTGELVNRVPLRADVRAVFHPAAWMDQPGLGVARTLQRRRAAVRYTPACVLSAVFLDGEAALIWSDSSRRAPGCRLVRSPTAVTALLDAAESIWDGAHDAASMLRCDDDSCYAVLGALSAGLTDEAAARHAGMSVRTYRRHVADLIRWLGARSRFDAGVRAATLGIVDPHRPGTGGVAR